MHQTFKRYYVSAIYNLSSSRKVINGTYRELDHAINYKAKS